MFNISVTLISKFSLTLSVPLQHVFSLSFANGIVPQQFKVAKVIPIFKSGSKFSTDNYRPISLLPVFSKVLEKIMCNRLSNFLESNNLLCKNQFGFRKDHSTVHPLTYFINFIAESLNKKEHTIAIFCDLKKAFDLVDHGILIKKLFNIGVRNTELLWFQDYLCNRKQFVCINGKNSFLRSISIGVPQGSILGPLLFLIYINDLSKHSNLFSTLFADDTKLFASGPDLVSLYDYVNQEFHKIVHYFRSHKLALNPLKTKFIVFSKSQSAKNPNLTICINNNNFGENNPNLIFPIEQITSTSEIPAAKLLGVFIDPHLNFKYHIQYISSKISKAMYFLRNAKNMLSQKGLKPIYYSLIHCHLVYANIIWGSARQSSYKCIYLKQKSAVRLISSAAYNAHSEPLFKSNNILPLYKLIEFFKLQFFQRFIQGFLPSALCNTWTKNSERNEAHHYALRNQDDFYIVTSRLTQFENFPLYSIPKVWNSFQNEEIKILRNKMEFNFKLKKVFLDNLNGEFICSRLLCPHCHL